MGPETTSTRSIIITMSAESLKKLLIEELQDLYHAEKQLVKALPKMAKAAQSDDLKAGITDHLEETKGHVERLERAFALLDEKPKAKVCPAMKGLIEEGAEALEEKDASAVRDAQIIGSAQRIEHYEMAAYGTVRSLAETLGEDEVAELLQTTLDEEGEADKKLTGLAADVNEAALEEDEAA
jgi:ferritin-like metal-binding protein YciE